MAKVESYGIPNFLGGINQGVDSSIIKLNEAANAQNCNIDRGVLSTAKGYAPFPVTALSAVIKTLMVYYKDNVGYLIAAAGGGLYKWNGTAWDTIATGFQSDYWDYINYNYNSTDVIILTNGLDNVKIYDGTTIRDLKFDSTQPDSETNKSPKGKKITLHSERIWIASDTALYASNDFNPEDWTQPTDSLEVNQHGVEVSMYNTTGSKVTGLTVVFDDIIIWLEKGINKIFGSDPTNYTKIGFSPKGGISDRSIANFEGGTFFIDKLGIFLYDGTNVQPMSQPLGNLFSTLNDAVIDKATGIVWGDKYILAVPEGSSMDNNLVIEYDFMRKNFMIKRGFKIASFGEYQGKLLYVGTDNKIYEYSVTDKFDTQSIEAFWETGYSDLGVPEASKDISDLYFTATGSGNIKISVTTENGTQSVTQTLVNTEKPYHLIFIHAGRLIKVRIENISGSSFTLKGFKMLYENDFD